MDFEFDLDLEQGGVPPRVKLSQYDNTTPVLKINLWYHGTAWSIPSGSAVYIAGTKKDKHGFEYTCTFSGSTVTATVTQQMTAVAGDVPTEIIIQKGTERKGTANFILEVEPAALADDIIVSDTILPSIIAGAAEQMEAAAQSASSAAASASSAASSESNASSSASSAAQSATNAATSETNAGNSAAAVETAASEAASSANSASSSASAAATSAGKAATSETSAINSASAAAQSATNAATSETNAGKSASSASTSEANAKTSASNAAASETNAAKSESNAQASATAASTSAGNAATSAIQAAASEAAASGYATTAGLSSKAAVSSAEDAEAWAVGQRGGVDVDKTDETYQNSAKYWANQAAGSASGGHVIMDGNGTVYSRRSNLQFDGATVTDDPTGDITKVKVQTGYIVYPEFDLSLSTGHLTATGGAGVDFVLSESGHLQAEVL